MRDNTEEKTTIVLDDEAEKLFRSIKGIDFARGVSSETGGIASEPDDLETEEIRLDAIRSLLIDLCHLLSVYFQHVNFWEGGKLEQEPFERLSGTLRELSRISGPNGSVLIRYRGFPGNSGVTSGNDYVVMFGSLMVDGAITTLMIKRLGIQQTHLFGRLARAFEVFSSHGINNLHLKIPGAEKADWGRLQFCLRILSRFQQAVKTGSPLTFIRSEKKVVLPPILDEMGRPDYNLTLVAALGTLSAGLIQDLIRRVDQHLRSQEEAGAGNPFANVYNALFALKGVREKLVRPPIEVNDMKWLLVDKDREVIPNVEAKVARFVSEGYGSSPKRAALVMKSVCGNDFGKVGSTEFGERLQIATELLSSLEKNPHGAKILEDVIEGIKSRYDQVREEVFEEVKVEEDRIEVGAGKSETLLGRVHAGLLKLVFFYKGRATTRKKIRGILHNTGDLELHDYETLAADFGISADSARHLISLLKKCFDNDGRFLKGAFEKNIPEFAKYEEKVFEFLWHYLKETRNRNDRVAFLSSFQQLIAKMQKPKAALRVLLSDLYRDPEAVGFSDRNALMLSTLLLRKYNKEVNLDIEITPEEILRVKDGLDGEVRKWVAGILEEDAERLFGKIRTIRRKITAVLDKDSSAPEPMPIRYLLSLEREIHIFLSLVEGPAALTVFRSAMRVYGDPEASIYRLKESPQNLAGLLQHLRVVLRGFLRIGGAGDLVLLKPILEKWSLFLRHDPGCEKSVKRLVEWGETARKTILLRNPSANG